ncbi:MAG: RNA-guided endonuclease InsQ/TnpB family protein, partial [Xenococcus sp. (in: cyanobacteria)]
KIGIVKIRHHRALPNGAILKSVQIIKKADGWYINLRLKDDSIPDFQAEIAPCWDNSLGMDAVLHEDDYLATSEGIKLPSLKSFRKSQSKLASVSKRKSARSKGSKARRKLAKKEAKIHQKIARSRKNHAYNTANELLLTGKQIFFHEKLNLKGLSQKNRPKQNESGKYLPNGQSAKSGLNKSWADAGFGQFFEILKYKAEKACDSFSRNLEIRRMTSFC